MKNAICVVAFLCLFITKSNGQLTTQTIRGSVVDSESKIPLIGANVKVTSSSDDLGTSTDLDGRFRIENVQIGRHDIVITYLGYKTRFISSILVISGKELVLNIDLEESAEQLDIVEVSANSSIDKKRPLNTFATVSSRTFSVEETSRYAAASFDPARMALNYAGVITGTSEDLFNEIIIRGNTPSGVLWRLDGIEIPNPNHFGDPGNSGGAISMLSSSTLSNSDFYTGAFPGEFGNATSGVFDLKMRNGNNENRETSFMFGALGVELATEGPISKKSKSSYLVNYRYSTLALLQAAGLNPAGEVLPTYQDLSFKFNFPTKKLGTFALFGLGGNNLAANNPPKDSLEWEKNSDRRGFEEKGTTGVLALSHNYLLSNDSYLKTIISGSIEKKTEDAFTLADNYDELIRYRDKVQQNTARASVMYHKKLNSRNSFRIGAIYSQKRFNFFSLDNDFPGDPLIELFNNKSTMGLGQAYAQWKHKSNDQLSYNFGVHYSLLTFNNANALEPRASVSYKINDGQELTFSSSLHSRMENPAVYFFEGTTDGGTIINSKDNLGLSKSFHNVMGYDVSLGRNMRLKAELYYQYLYNIPVRPDENETFTLLNAKDIWDVFGEPDLVAEGTGTNIGLDLTIEKFFTNGHYFMITSSLYDSKFKTLDNRTFNTRFNGNYQLTTLGGKEWKLGKKGNKIFAINGKFIISGGARFTPIDLDASIAAEDEVFLFDQLNDGRAGTYYRLDWGISYKINGKKSTHTIMFDIQNTTNRENPSERYFDDETLTIESEDQTGLFPFFNYRVEF